MEVKCGTKTVFPYALPWEFRNTPRLSVMVVADLLRYGVMNAMSILTYMRSASGQMEC